LLNKASNFFQQDLKLISSNKFPKNMAECCQSSCETHSESDTFLSGYDPKRKIERNNAFQLPDSAHSDITPRGESPA
jgi:hypothetical protein